LGIVSLWWQFTDHDMTMAWPHTTTVLDPRPCHYTTHCRRYKKVKMAWFYGLSRCDFTSYYYNFLALTCRHVTFAQKNGANLPPHRAPWHSSHNWSSRTYGFTSTWNININTCFKGFFQFFGCFFWRFFGISFSDFFSKSLTNCVLNKTENHFSPYPRSRINLYTRLKIAISW
jgi:hypothetical protein